MRRRKKHRTMRRPTRPRPCRPSRRDPRPRSRRDRPRPPRSASNDSVEIRVERPVEIRVERPVEIRVERPVEIRVERPVEIRVERPVEIRVERPVEVRVDGCVDDDDDPAVVGVDGGVDRGVVCGVAPRVDGAHVERRGRVARHRHRRREVRRVVSGASPSRPVPAALLSSTTAQPVAAAPSNWLAVPYPTRSTQPPTVHGVKVEPHAFSLLDVRTRATLPFDALMSVVPEASSVGNATPLTPPANLMRKYWPGWRLKLGRSTARPALLLTKLLAVAAY